MLKTDRYTKYNTINVKNQWNKEHDYGTGIKLN